MTKVYFKDENGQKMSVEGTDEVAAADAETRRGIRMNEAKERLPRANLGHSDRL
jgi:hypothetical protein